MLYTKRIETEHYIMIKLAHEPFTDGVWQHAYDITVSTPFGIGEDGKPNMPRVVITLLGLWNNPSSDAVRAFATDLITVAEEADRLEVEAQSRFLAWEAERQQQ